jgi:hypothetical protein
MRRLGLPILLLACEEACAFIPPQFPRSEWALYTSSFDFTEVSDAQALLACRWYLQRRNRLGEWTNRTMKQSFWTGGDEVLYKEALLASQVANKDKEDELDDSIDSLEDDDEDDDDFEESLDDEDEIIVKKSTTYSQETDIGEEYDDDDEADMLDSESDDFGVFDKEPPALYVKRSQSARKTWSDPEWREYWYQQRWGGRRGKPAVKPGLEKRVYQAQGILTHPALLRMSELEIAQAIQAYTRYTKQRTKSPTIQEQPTNKNITTRRVEPWSPGNYSSQESATQAKQAQLERSQRARQAYNTRINNNKQSAIQAAARRRRLSFASSNKSPSDRIEQALDAGKLPEAADVVLLCEPLRLAKRKALLRRILADSFDKRGKCVPIDERVEFVTNCSIEQLRDYILELIKEHELKSDSDVK